VKAFMSLCYVYCVDEHIHSKIYYEIKHGHYSLFHLQNLMTAKTCKEVLFLAVFVIRF
jgi:hypothetical protein